MERGESREFKILMAEVQLAGAAYCQGGGSTNTAEVTAGRSLFGQQDIAQAVTAAMSGPQSI